MSSVNDYVRIASGHYLTEYLPDNHMDMSEAELLSFANDHVMEIYEQIPPNAILNMIDDLADTMADVVEDAVRSELSLLDKGMLWDRKTHTHANPNGPGLVTWDYVYISFKEQDWKRLIHGNTKS
jgi:hypothetical protein